VEFDGGGCSLALHKGGAARSSDRGPKVVFGTNDVKKSREILIERGAKMGKVKIFGPLNLCEGKDPEGNRFQLSNRP
jgi:hypothetical protein